MKSITLYCDVQTLGNRVLLSEGTEVDTECIEELISTSNNSYQKFKLMEYGTVRRDLEKALAVDNYRPLFPDKGTVNAVLSDMAEVELIEPVLKMLDFFKAHDPYSYRHFLTVYALSTLIARTLMPDDRERRRLIETGPTHDFGKTSVPMRILRKSTALTVKETNIVRGHAVFGYVLLSYYHADPSCLSSVIARDHHERLNGMGHPRGIELTDKIVEIVSVCDVFDALLSPRPYRPISYDKRTAIEEITSLAGQGEFSWDIVKALISHNRKNKPHYEDVVVTRNNRGVPPAGNMYGKTAPPEEGE